MSRLGMFHEDEMRALLASSREFSERHRDAGAALSLHDPARRDSGAERLFQAFSFLHARVREDVVDDDRGIVDDLLGMVGRGVGFPAASPAMVEFVPGDGFPASGVGLPAGARVHGWSRARDRRFQAATGADCRIHAVAGASLAISGTACGCELELDFHAAVPRARWPDRLDLYVDGDFDRAWALRGILLRAAGIPHVEGSGAIGRVARSMGGPYPGPGGGPGNALVDLRDLLRGDDRLRFVRLDGLDAAVPEGAPAARVRIPLVGIGVARAAELCDGIRLLANCVPVGGARVAEMEPIADPGAGWRGVVARGDSGAVVLELDRCRLVRRSDPSRGRECAHPWDPDASRALVARTRGSSLAEGRSGLFVSIASTPPVGTVADEILVGTAWICDGDDPRRLLGEAGFDEPGPGVPPGVGVRALGRPGRIAAGRTDPDSRESLLRFLVEGRASLGSVAGLRSFLSSIDGLPSDEGNPLVEGIRDVVVESRPMLVPGGRIERESAMRIGWEANDARPPSTALLARLDELALLLCRILSRWDERISVELVARPGAVSFGHRS